ncbi:BBS2 [Blepharisma stoltei]|uniref:Bardet-Biedl syndrome 2 protein homolog n=1 Tax=Blepharisma stoltei TaxID=1481888 RepID=A0AAU9K038_9CILI|nr:unnamed protein product [Blepharisma stoltei]
MLSSAYTFELNQAVLHSLATISYFDGIHPTLACGITGGKVLIHTPHIPNSSNNFLNINKNIICLDGGRLDPSLNRDVLVIGSPSSLMAYDIDSNSDLFHTETKEGVTSLTLGSLSISGRDTPLALVGGNCSVKGFNKLGEEEFWTVSGDDVSAIGFFRTERNEKRLLVGGTDYAIRIFNNEELETEIMENAKITGFAEMDKGKFAYTLDNGGIGIYKGKHRAWKAKAKNKVLSIVSGDVTGDGVPDMILGWSNGKLEVRSENKGENIFKKSLKQTIAKVFYTDYRMQGKNQVIACTVAGRVLGYIKEDIPHKEQNAEAQQEDIEDLMRVKQILLNELQHYKDAAARSGSSILAPGTSLLVTLAPSPPRIFLSTSNSSLIKCAFVLGEGFFEGDSKFVHPARPSSELQIPIQNPKHLGLEVDIKALVCASAGASQLQVMERSIKIPKFCNFEYGDCKLPSGYVNFDFPQGNRLLNWLQDRFILNPSAIKPSAELQVSFLGESENLSFILTTNKLSIYTETLELAAEIAQDLISFFNIPELESRADYPHEIEKINGLMEKVEEYSNVRTQLSINMAENAQNVKALIVKAEDSRIQRNMGFFKQAMASLHQFNGELLSEFQIRTNNHNELLSYLKQVNQYIQRAGNLRYGQAKTRTIASFREAVKTKNMKMIAAAIISGGKAS